MELNDIKGDMRLLACPRPDQAKPEIDQSKAAHAECEVCGDAVISNPANYRLKDELKLTIICIDCCYRLKAKIEARGEPMVCLPAEKLREVAKYGKSGEETI